MELEDLQFLVEDFRKLLKMTFQNCDLKIDVDFPTSPNPLCFFELDCSLFIQGSFWANNEFKLEAIDLDDPSKHEMIEGTYNDRENAKSILRSFLCKLQV